MMEPTYWNVDIAEVLDDVKSELVKATKKFGHFSSPHEGYAILLEEVDELWTEVKQGTPQHMREEAIQVAAMAIRFILDSCND